MRLAQTYLVRAEAYGRKGMYDRAVDDINVLRQRAAFRSGENRPEVLVQWEPKAVALSAVEKISPYPANRSSYNALRITTNIFTPGTPEAQAEHYIPTASCMQDLFIQFI